MAIKRRDLRRALVNKFRFNPESGKHETFVLKSGREKLATTWLSWGHREIDDTILRKIARQLGVDRLGQVYEMVECDLDRDKYLEILKD